MTVHLVEAMEDDDVKCRGTEKLDPFFVVGHGWDVGLSFCWTRFIRVLVLLLVLVLVLVADVG